MEKKSYYCKKLEKTLHFLPDYIKFCCTCALGPGLKIQDFNNLNQKELNKKKKEVINALEKGIIPYECTNCIEYKEKEPYNFFQRIFYKTDKISSIIVNHYKQCDCNCIYCSQKIIYTEKQKNYKLTPIIKKLYEKDLIDKENLEVEFQGGNVSMLEEFDEITSLFVENHCKEIRILTNGIKFLPILEKIQGKTNLLLVISLDAGTPETFKEIKQVDKFNDVIENLNTYEKYSRTSLSLKYIIIKGVNDNKEELKQFLDIANKYKRITTIIDIDYRDILMKAPNTKFVIPKHYYELIEFATKYSQDNNINFHVNPYSQMVLDKGEA